MKTNSKGMIATALALAAGLGVGLGFGAPIHAHMRRLSKQSKRPTVVRDIAAEQALATEHQRWNREVDAKKRIKQNIKVEKEYAKRSDDLDTFRENLRIEQTARQMAAGLKGPIECKMKLPKE